MLQYRGIDIRLQAVDFIAHPSYYFAAQRGAGCFLHRMNIPNSLTILRILLIPVYVGLLIYERFNGAMIVLLVAGVTDALDGTIARAANQRTRLGAFLDPLADKLLLTSGFVTLSAIHLIPTWVTILVVSRDAMLLLGTAVAQFTESNIDIAPTVFGKGATFLQLSYVLLVIFLSSRHLDLSVLTPLLITMVAFTVSSGCHYLYRGYRSVGASPT